MSRRRSFLCVFSLLAVFQAEAAYAAACCGGSFASPSLVAGSDDRAQITTAFSRNELTADVYGDGRWNGRNYDESVETLRFDGARIFADRYQAGFSLPLVRREREGRASSGFGDVAGTLGYEYLPDWDYHPWRPKGIGFLQLILPTGKSVYESDDNMQLDARGRGFWALGAGTLLTKTFSRIDAFANLDVHYSFDKSFSYPASAGAGGGLAAGESRGRLEPGWGGNLSVGGGYNWRSWRLGGTLQWTYEDPITVRALVNSKTSAERFATASLSLSYLMNEAWAATFTYADQTLIGDPVNTRLGRLATLQLQTRWSR